ncbi:cell division protein SepF [Dehalobacterium formicoaceticum]|uniref:Cell division protein SepF n=1 Tax=Dehalobacterium formicoaceticum TaxID=51515 RepID=A0ABT1Y100_9FIRM|nr:cell division protein SepF [Dehalobacterium formicoaceticum]MCR6544537.1 cell division protein SepF [Dehalobacterium formicoaceticum]
MSKILDKMMGAIGFEVAEEEEIIETTEENYAQNDREKRQKKANLLGLPSQRPVTMMLVKAESYDEVESIGQNIKERRPVIVNFDDVDKETAQRMIDFLSGAVFALDGSVQKVSMGTFLFATTNLDVVGQIAAEYVEEYKENNFFKGFAWNKK